MSQKSPPSRVADQFVARFPEGLRAELANVAHANGRSMNAEIVFRLRASLNGFDYTALPSQVVQAVEVTMAASGLSQEEALTKLVLAGQSQGGTVLHLHVAPGTTAKDVHTALTAALKLIPPDSNVISAQG